MLLRDAQRDLRTVFLGGAAGALVAGALWLISAAAVPWHSERLAVMVLVFGGVLIFPGSLLVLRALGRSTRLEPGNPLGALAMQVAFTVPLAIPVILAATRHRPEWFYPAFMIIVGAPRSSSADGSREHCCSASRSWLGLPRGAKPWPDPRSAESPQREVELPEDGAALDLGRGLEGDRDRAPFLGR